MSEKSRISSAVAKGGRYWFSRMVRRLLGGVLAIKEFVWHQLTIFLLEVNENFMHSVIDGISHAISDNRDIHLFGCSGNLLNEVLIDFCHFTKNTHFLGVGYSHVSVCVGGCAVWDDKWTQVSRVDKGNVHNERTLHIGEQ